MAITAVIGAMAYSGLNGVIQGTTASRAEAERMYQLDRAMTLIARDVRQFVERPIRDEFGLWEPAIMGGQAAEYPLSLTRTGWANTNGMARSQLQRVRYLVEEGTLWRENWLVLDRSVDSEPQRQKLVAGVDALELEFLADVQGLNPEQLLREGWVDNWNARETASLTQQPLAIAVLLELQGSGIVRRVYELPQY